MNTNPPFRKSSKLSRRTFLKRSALVAAPMIVPGSVFGLDGTVAPSNRITIGCIGVGGQGGSNMGAFLGLPNAQVVAVCDVDCHRRDNAKAGVDGRYGDQGCMSYNDFREIIAREDIDAVSIGTPDHWHAVITTAAARAGKDIYCEKPLSLTIGEGRSIVDVVRKYGRVLQTGTWRRSRNGCRRACELVRNGRIGELKTIKIGVPLGFAIRGGDQAALEKPSEVPVGFDYDMWLGPAPWAPYAEGRCHFNFRWIMDYGEGYISDWGAHYYDIGQWANGTDHTGPVSVEGTAEFPRTGLYDGPINHHLTFTYANGVKMISVATSDQSQWGMRYEGTEGWLHVESETITGEPQSAIDSRFSVNDLRLYASDNHHANFLECIQTRKETAATAEIGHRSATICHIGSICALLGRPLKWDPVAERFDDESANRLLTRPMRSPWSLAC
ncbi:MAG TPA: Gfo/Idh/MocA family oxidoreductase [Candidatus Hydrogenedentes bacterium]|nr:Gfo/Idh/MocA family oxidoreductase [Candidatus Hydrogenedentota bacterium]